MKKMKNIQTISLIISITKMGKYFFQITSLRQTDRTRSSKTIMSHNGTSYNDVYSEWFECNCFNICSFERQMKKMIANVHWIQSISY